jgi:putative ABC transport system permease protein
VGRVVLVARLAARDLRRRPVEAALLLLAILGATTTLTLGLVLSGITRGAYESTRKATAGPDVVASVSPAPRSSAGRAALEELAVAPGVAARSGPFPVTWASLKAQSRSTPVRVDGRDRAPASVDRPELVEGSWVRDGGAVLEAAFADALGLDVGDSITLNGLDLAHGPSSAIVGRKSMTFRVVGVAVTAASVPYPAVSCLAFCPGNAGLVWLTRSDVRSLVAPRQLLYVSYLRLVDPDSAPAFVAAHNPPPNAPPGTGASDALPPLLRSWQQISANSADLVENQRRALLTGGWLLVVLAVASVAVLVGSRMADQIRRVGLLKAIGGTPSLVAAVLLAEYVVVALLAAVAGLVLGRLAAPLITEPSAGLLGRGAGPALTASTIVLVIAVALAVAVAATFVPALRAARTSTVRALADAARAPRRTGWLIGLSARLPVSLMLGVRVAARRPRRVVLATAGIAITVSGIVAALAAHADIGVGQLAPVADQLSGAGGSAGEASRADRLNQVLLVITLTLVALATVNALFITWATALDARRSSALARALGATPRQVGAGLSAAQVLPALVGAVLGIPGGILLIELADPDSTTTLPPLWQLLAVVPATVLVVAALTAIPARIGARHSVADVLASELA